MNDAPLPVSEHTEVAILGAMLLDPVAIQDATAKLKAEDFSLDSHQRIYNVILAVVKRDGTADSLTVAAELDRRKELDSVGGRSYIAFLSEGIPRHFNIESYVRIVKQKSQLRALMREGHNLGVVSGDDSEDPREIGDRYIEHLREIVDDAEDVQLQPVRDIVGTTGTLSEKLAVRDGIPFGFRELDEATGGAHRGELIIIAARPSMGKTALLCSVAHHMAVVQRKNVGVFSMEQKAPALVSRMVSGASGVAYQDIRKGQVREYDRILVTERYEMLADSPLYILDKPGLTVARIRSMASKLKRELERVGETLDVILIDQLSKMSDADSYQKGMQRYQVIGKQTNGLTLLAKELDVAVVLLVQIGREGAKRGGENRPQLTDLKDSGNIEEDADVVLFPHRPKYYDAASQEADEIIIAKQREGPTMICKVAYQPKTMNWHDLPQERY